VITVGSTRKLTESSDAEQQLKDMQRMLAKAEQKIRKLQDRAADQKQQIRELQSQVKHEENLASEREELKAEIADLRNETKELIRANREHADKVEVLRAENAKLRAGVKVQKPSGTAASAAPRGLLQPSLS
jgi:chromosome segregation ATPase